MHRGARTNRFKNYMVILRVIQHQIMLLTRWYKAHVMKTIKDLIALQVFNVLIIPICIMLTKCEKDICME